MDRAFEAFAARNDLSGRIFLSVTQFLPNPTQSVGRDTETDSIPWQFLAFEPATGSWLELPGIAGAFFWVAPDGSKILLPWEGALWLRRIQGQARCLFELPAPTPLVYQGAWSPDGRQFAVSYRPAGTSYLYGNLQTWLLEADGSEKTRLPIPPTDGVRDWSHNGEWLLTLRQRHSNDKRRICLVHPDGTLGRMLVTNRSCAQARFSPSGSQIASTCGPRDDPSRPPDPRERGAVWLSDLEGANERMVFGHSEMCCQDVHWSPNGTWLCVTGFHRHPGPSPGSGTLDISQPFIILIDLVNGDIRQLVLPKRFRMFRSSAITWR